MKEFRVTIDVVTTDDAYEQEVERKINACAIVAGYQPNYVTATRTS